jgi:Lon protease-like protein
MSVEPLPLFPLNVVLFPRMPLPLHIFEERYQVMIKRCVEEGRPFGVLLIREGSEVGRSAVPQNVGTLARIHAIEPLTEGRLNILTVGTERFRLIDYVTDQEPYLVGFVETFHDEPTQREALSELVREVTGLFHEYFHALVDHVGIEMPEYELPDDPEELSFVLAAVVQQPLEQRQEFLEMTDTAERLRQEKALLEQQMTLLRAHSPEKPRHLVFRPFDVKGWQQNISRN